MIYVDETGEYKEEVVSFLGSGTALQQRGTHLPPARARGGVSWLIFSTSTICFFGYG